MTKLTCMYCSGDCERFNPTSMWFTCESCDAHFYEEDGNIGITFYRDIKDKRYRIEVVPHRPKTYLFQLKPEFSLLFETKEAMHITPQTALNKIKHLLMFL